MGIRVIPFDICPDSLHAHDYKVVSRLHELGLSMFTTTQHEFPRLKSKAAETKHLAPALLHAFGN